MRLKMRRLLGCRRRGRGWRSNRSGARGGVGRAGLWDHKNTTRILAMRKTLKVSNIRDIQARLEHYIKKKIAIRKGENYVFPCGKLCKTHKKILSVGQPSGAYTFCKHIRQSEYTKIKLAPTV